MTSSIHKVLIANRGEIACRIVAACRELGIRCVAVYSDADREALHVQLADEAVALGGSEPGESYLAIDKLLQAARTAGADALHPGYGFRAESAELARACDERGIRFIGPTEESLRRMGDKRAARELAREAGVPVVPGYEGSPAGAAEAARRIGYPILVKAALGGGGKGMRRVTGDAELAGALESASRLAGRAFGDASVYLERYLEGARHVEVQLLGDGQGGAVHLYERECSLQRRHQKLIEEAPSPALDEELRERITTSAVALAKRVRYRSAGTAEFLLAPGGEYYFLEMNTRIQVEHPVTELLTGVDLVKQQLQLARGAPLPAQHGIGRRGHAVEARIVAEDVTQGFLPQAGQLLRFDVPAYPFVRLDTGYATGSVVPVEYDSLLAKLIVWGSDREEAWTRLRVALDGTILHGVRSNLGLLRFLARDEQVLEGDLSTTLLEGTLLERYLEGASHPVPPVLLAAAAVAELLGAPAAVRSLAGPGHDMAGPFQRLGRFRLGGLE